MSELLKPCDIPLKTEYGFELPDVLIHVSGEVKTLFYMLKEYESMKHDRKINNNDMMVLLFAEYQKRHGLNFWNPERPQYVKIAELIDIE
jgi:hypothetical protein